MRKLLAGCLFVGALGAVALAVAAYVGYRAARPMFDSASTWARQARDAADASRRIDNQGAFDAPAGGELDPRRVRRFLAVQDRVRRSLGPKWADLERRAREIEQAALDGDPQTSLTRIGSWLTDAGGLLTETRRAHVEALNAEGFSAEEYAWVRRRIYEAAGIELAGSLDWGRIDALVKEGAQRAGLDPPELALHLPEIPDVNRTLVRPHTGELRNSLPLAILGF